MNLFSTLTSNLDLEAAFLDTPPATWTFGEVLDLSARMAGSLRAAGVEPGERVVVVLPKSAHSVAVYLACLRIGAIYVPLNPAYTDPEISFFISDASPRIVIAENELPDAPTLTMGPTGVGSLLGVEETFVGTVERADADGAAILYTSGTTGRSKGAMLTHGCLSDNALTLFDIWRWQPDDVLLHALPIFHVHGLFVALHCALLGGSRVIFMEQFDAASVRGRLPMATVMMGVPTFYARLLSDPEFGPDDCTNMRLFISGSAPLAEHVFAEFARRTGHTILERYGMTEAGMICSNPYDGPREAGTVGFPLPGYVARVADESDRPVPVGKVGILQIRGPSLFGGYWQLPDKTAESYTADQYFRTGDLARMDDAGRVTLLGRSHDLIITGGFNVYPKEIERILNEVAGVSETAVVGHPDDDLGEIPVAYVVGDAEEASLRGHAASQLARYKQPRRYVFVDALPRNAMGKVQKSALRPG